MPSHLPIGLSWKSAKKTKVFRKTAHGRGPRADYPKIWKQKRGPDLLATSCPDISAAGDVRAGAMNRVALAAGQGSMAVSLVNRYLAEVK